MDRVSSAGFSNILFETIYLDLYGEKSVEKQNSTQRRRRANGTREAKAMLAVHSCLVHTKASSRRAVPVDGSMDKLPQFVIPCVVIDCCLCPSCVDVDADVYQN
jgi:hypothetical protein